VTEDSRNHSVLDDYASIISDLHSNLLSVIDNVNRKFNIHFNLDIEVKSNTIIIKGIEEYSFPIYKWFQHGVASHIPTIELHCENFPFYPYHFNNATFSLIVDENFKLVSVHFKSRVLIDNILSHFVLKFNEHLDLTEILAQTLGVRVSTRYSITKEGEQLCSLEDESEFFKYYLYSRTDIINLLPECYMPSAYDFNSVDFQDRLKLFDMIIC
jgi:hypothetical protein